MREPARIALSVALLALPLAVGLFVYDGMRRAPSAPLLEPEEGAGRRSAAQASARGDEGAEDPRRLVELSDRLRRLEERVPELAPSGAGSTSSVGDPRRSRAPATFDPAQLPAFRALYESVERSRRDEGIRSSIQAELKRLDVRLSPGEEATVFEETLRLWEGRNEVWRSAGPRAADEFGRRETAAQVQTLEETWAQAIRRALRPEDAEKVVAALGRGMAAAPGMPFGPEPGPGR